MVMLVSTVVFLPRLRVAERRNGFPWRVPIERRQLSVHTALVHEDEPLRLRLPGHHHPPGRPIELVAFGGYASFWPESAESLANEPVDRMIRYPLWNPRCGESGKTGPRTITRHSPAQGPVQSSPDLRIKRLGGKTLLLEPWPTCSPMP